SVGADRRRFSENLARAPDRFGDEDRAFTVDLACWRRVRMTIWSVEVDDIAQLPEHEAGRHREDRSAHVADHDLLPEPSRGARHCDGLGQAAALVELDIDDIEMVG